MHKIPDTNVAFVLRTDVSNARVGIILLQYDKNIPHPVTYTSRRLLDCETSYNTIEKECLPVVIGALKFDYCVVGKIFALEVDYKPLVYINVTNVTTDLLSRSY